MRLRRFAGRAGSRPRRRLVIALPAALALAAGLWAGAQARQGMRPLDHHAVVLNAGVVGSAFLIDPELALTNAHVVAGLAPGAGVTLVSPTRGVSATARLVAVSARMDLALLRAPAGFAPPVGAENARARTGLAVRGAGVDASGGPGYGPRMELAGAVVVARAAFGAYGPGLVVSMPGVRPGFSGGPVLDAEGRLVGMITAIRASAGRAAPASGVAPARSRAPDEAFVLRAEAIRAEARRLLRLARE